MILPRTQFAEEYDAFGMNRSGMRFASYDSGIPGILDNPVDDPVNPKKFMSGVTYKDLTVQKLIVGGGKQITIGPEDDIQAALDEINEAGGGILHLSPGIYKPNGTIQVYSTIEIRGLNQTDTVIDFNNQAYNFILVGTDIHTDGTISSISGGVNVTGSSTNWTTAMIGRQIFIDERWYVITNVSSGTALTISSGYADGATFAGTYRIATPVSDVTFKNLSIKNSTATAISATDVREIFIQFVSFLDNNKGYSFTNFMNCIWDVVQTLSSTSNGYELTNGSFGNSYSSASIANGGHGVVLNNIKTCGWILSASNVNTGDGFNGVNCNNLLLNVEVAGNGGQGIDISFA